MAKVNKNTSKAQQKKKTEKAVSSLSIIHPNAAGIDIGQTIHAVAVAPGSVSESEDPVRIFGAMTSCDKNNAIESRAQALNAHALLHAPGGKIQDKTIQEHIYPVIAGKTGHSF